MVLYLVAALLLPLTLEARKPSFARVFKEVIHNNQVLRGEAAKLLELPVNPWNALTSTTYTMRYWVNDSHWNGSDGAPVFLSMGGEGAAGPPGGQLMELAEQHGGLAFAIEHRYYGESIPAPTFSTEDLEWLSARLALADAAQFRRAMAKRFNMSSSSRWITFGGSYSGELAAWARLKYPDLFYAAVASSAPVTAIVDYDGYDPIVANALKREDLGGSQFCYDAVAAAFVALEDYFENNRSALQNIFRTCGPIEVDGDAFLLHDYVSDDFMGLVQYNIDLPGRINIRSRCAQMVSTTYGETPFDRLVNITLERAKNDACIFDEDPSGVQDSISFAAHLAGYANVNNSGRSFPYQMCVDGVGHDQTCKPERGCIFSPRFAARSFFQEQCHAAFGVTAEETDKAVEMVSTSFGDANLGATRVVFINGDIDPFHYGSVTKNSTELLARDIVAYMVKGGSHCQDMGRMDPNSDTPAMTAVKTAKAAIVGRWLSESLSATAPITRDETVVLV